MHYCYYLYVQAYALIVPIAVVTPVRRVITNDQGLTGGTSSIVTFLILFVVSLLFLIVYLCISTKLHWISSFSIHLSNPLEKLPRAPITTGAA